MLDLALSTSKEALSGTLRQKTVNLSAPVPICPPLSLFVHFYAFFSMEHIAVRYSDFSPASPV